MKKTIAILAASACLMFSFGAIASDVGTKKRLSQVDDVLDGVFAMTTFGAQAIALAEDDNPLGKRVIAESILLKQGHVAGTIKKAEEFLREAAKQGDIVAKVILSFCLEIECFGYQDLSESEKWALSVKPQIAALPKDKVGAVKANIDRLEDELVKRFNYQLEE